MKRFSIILIAAFALLLYSCSASTPQVNLDQTKIVNKNPLFWTKEDCDKVIQSYTRTNYFVSDDLTADEVIVYATPYVPDVIFAMVKKQAITRRFTDKMFYARLKEYLEKYTSLTVNESTGKIIPNTYLSEEDKQELSFYLRFRNNTSDFHPIEIYKVEEGFFIQNDSGKFGRVKVVDSYSIDNYFYLIDESSGVFTFSLLNDSGEAVFESENPAKFNLVLSGLMSTDIVFLWEIKQRLVN